jgi:hypothetical protein
MLVAVLEATQCMGAAAANLETRDAQFDVQIIPVSGAT